MARYILAPVDAGCADAAGLRLGPERMLAHVSPGERGEHEVRRPALGDGSVGAATAAVAGEAARLVAAGDFVVVLGGDHTAALGGVTGVQQGLRRRSAQGDGRRRTRGEPLFVLWLDAHPDVNTAATSPSGNLHGMVLSGLLGRGPLAISRPLPAARVVLAGVRSFDPGEIAFLQARPDLVIWDVETLRGDSWRERAGELLARVRRAGGRLYVSLDLDVLDPEHAPGVAVPVANGAHPDAVLDLLRHLRASGLLAGADVVELYPPADVGERTARLAARAVEALAGTPAELPLSSAA